MDKLMDGWIDGWMDGWIDGWMEGWMDEWMYGELTNIYNVQIMLQKNGKLLK